MTVDIIIEQVRENAKEWLEMTDNPDALVSGILAYKIIKLNEHIEYLEKRLHTCQKR